MMNPDRWLLIWIDDGAGPPFVKVFGTWAGGYTTGDSWRLNSGIDNVVTLDEDGWIVRRVWYTLSSSRPVLWDCRWVEPLCTPEFVGEIPQSNQYLDRG